MSTETEHYLQAYYPVPSGSENEADEFEEDDEDANCIYVRRDALSIEDRSNIVAELRRQSTSLMAHADLLEREAEQ